MKKGTVMNGKIIRYFCVFLYMFLAAAISPAFADGEETKSHGTILPGENQGVKPFEDKAADVVPGSIQGEETATKKDVKVVPSGKAAAAREAKEKRAKEKARLSQKRREAYEAQIKALKKNLEELKSQSSGKKGFMKKALMSLAVITIGLVLFLLLRLGVKGVERAVTKKGEIREDDITLRIRTLSKLFNWLGGVMILIVVVYMVLRVFGLDVAPLLAGAGIIGLAFGFGGQYLIRDLINGLFILIEGQYRVDDVVKIGEHGGLVEDINLRVTTLRDLEGRIIIIPNGEIKTVINFTKEYAYALLDIGVAYKENVDRVMDIIKELGREMRKDGHFGRLILEDLEMLGVDDLGDSQVTIRFRIKTLPIKQWDIMREFRRRIKNKFDELGVEIPFPHRTIYWGAGADNDWVRGFANRISAK